MLHSNRCALTSCTAPLPSGKKYVAVELLTKEILYFVVDVKSKGEELFDQVCNYLGLNDSELFGLALYIGEEYQFIDLSIKISKYAPKAWKSHQGYGVDEYGKPLLTVYFKIQYYVDCHLLINDKITRHFYYLQLLHNVVNYSLSVSQEKAFLLAAYALQADFGNYSRERHKDKYFEVQKYFPARDIDKLRKDNKFVIRFRNFTELIYKYLYKIIKKLGEDYIVKHIPAVHIDNMSLSRGEAQVMYIKEASDNAAPHNLHFYKMHRKKTKNDLNIWLGICAKGIDIYEENNFGLKNKLSTFLWPDIAKLYFDKRKFEIHSLGCPEERRFTYYASTEDLAKSLLWLCRMTHQFHMVTQTRVQELKQLEIEGDKPYRESYIYSDSLDMAWEKQQRNHHQDHISLPCSISRLKKAGTSGCGNEQRVSVISNTSSNTTSGIVSDRIQSFDESEDDVDLEIADLTPVIHHSLDVITAKNRQFNSQSKANQDNSSQHSGNSDLSLSIESNMDGQLSVPSSICCSPDCKRTTPTSSLLSGGSYTSFTDSTHSSSSQLSAITVKANLISPRVRVLSGTSCCVRPCCSDIAKNDNSPNNSIYNCAQRDFTISAAVSKCLSSVHMECQNNIKNNCNQKNGISKLSPQEVELLLEKQLHQRQDCSYKCLNNKLSSPTVPHCFADQELSSTTQTHLCDNAHIINAFCNKQCLKETAHRGSNLAMQCSLYSSQPSISQAAHVFNEDTSRNYSNSVKFQSLPFRSMLYSPTSFSSHLHARNATRIGVSSLTRHRTPLSVCCSSNNNNNRTPIAMTVSEPNLCYSNIWPEYQNVPLNSCKLSSHNYLYNHQNHQHHMSDKKHPDNSLVYKNFVNSNSSIESSSNITNHCDNNDSLADFDDFPCIPPPLAYQTSSEKISNDASYHYTNGMHLCHKNCTSRNIPAAYFSKSLESLPSLIDSKQLMMKNSHNGCSTDRSLKLARKSESIPSIFKSIPNENKSLAIRERSKYLDIPLISALCNDRSLLMLPKTVPTCSRQRHIGTKDFRRFSCSYIHSLQSDNIQNISNSAQSSYGSLNRPVSWHIDSSDHLWLKNFSRFSTLHNVLSDNGTNTTQGVDFSSRIPRSCPFSSCSSHIFNTEFQRSHAVYCQQPSAVMTSFDNERPSNMHHIAFCEQYDKNMYSAR